jgi:uncharacterized membrane protein
MRFLAKLFLRGLAAILPLVLTGYLVYYAVDAGETLLKGVVDWLFPGHYRAGMGWAVSIVLVMAVGLLMYTVVARVIYSAISRLLQRIPLVKSLYGMVVDVVRLLGSGDKRQFGKVVLVRLQGTEAELLGFVTRETFDDLPEGFAPADHVAVYLPMSYQLGGFTVVVPRTNVRPVRMGGEEALRWAVTAGVAPAERG